MVSFELSRLLDYNDESLLAGLRRVALLVPGQLTLGAFRKHSKASPSVYKRGLGDRYSGRAVSPKMRKQTARRLTDDQITAELQRVAEIVDPNPVTTEDLKAFSAISESVVRRRFGSWNAAMRKAGLAVPTRARRHTDEEYFENLLAVWSAFGRQPKYGEMDRPPSTISAVACRSSRSSRPRPHPTTPHETPDSLQTNRPARQRLHLHRSGKVRPVGASLHLSPPRIGEPVPCTVTTSPCSCSPNFPPTADCAASTACRLCPTSDTSPIEH
jgi:hypothetical protein